MSVNLEFQKHCSVCFKDIDPKNVTTLCCEHVFHNACITGSSPLCEKKIAVNYSSEIPFLDKILEFRLVNSTTTPSLNNVVTKIGRKQNVP